MKLSTRYRFFSKLKTKVCLISLALSHVLHLSAQTITTIAGSSSKGDGGPAYDANLSSPKGIIVDGNGNLLIADSNNHRIRKVDINGVITTIAGNGTKGFSGDGGLATDATLNYPGGIVIDASGNLFITDTQNQRIRKVDSNGIITTIVGDGTAGYSGNNGPATSAKLNYPTMAIVDRSGNLFIADKENYRVRKVSPNGVITTVAGTGVQAYGSADGGAAAATRLALPVGVAIDASNNLLIVDDFDNRIRKVDANGIITTVVGTGSRGYSGDGGAATQANLYSPTSVATDSQGNLFVMDAGNLRVRKVDANGIITTIAGSGTVGFSGDGGVATQASLNMATAVAVDSQGNLFITDQSNHRVRKVDTNGIITTYVGNGTDSYGGDGRAATLAMMNTPTRVAVDKNGNVFIADSHNHRIRKVDTNGIITTFAGSNAGGFGSVPSTLVNLNNPFGLAVDDQNNLLIADQGNSRILKINTNGNVSTVVSTNDPTAIALDKNGNLFVIDNAHRIVRKVSRNGTITTVAGNGIYGSDGDGEAATEAKLANPAGLAVDDQGNLYIADAYGQRIRKVDANGIITTVAGNGIAGYSGDGGAATLAQLNNPIDVAFDNQGNLYIADTQNQRIRKVDTNGIITNVAGNGGPGFSGDGSPAPAARFYNPYGIALDANRNLFIVDLGNQRVRKVNATTSVGRMIVSVQSGDWSTASTWDCNCVPDSNDTATISTEHNVTVSQSVQIDALKVYGHLQYTAVGKVSFQTNSQR